MTTLQTTSFWARCGGGTALDRRHMGWFLCSLIVWALCFVTVAHWSRSEPAPTGWTAWGIALLPSLAAIVAVLFYGRYLRHTDELQRLVQLRALALGFGATWVAISGYPILERLGAPSADIGDYAVVMAVAFTLGNFFGWTRYQ